MLGKGLFVVAGLLVGTVDASRARAQTRSDTAAIAPTKREGSWSAATANGLTLMGTWTAFLDSTGTVTGTWALADAQGNTRAAGGWSAAKASDRWNGAWRAMISGRPGEYSGTWTAAVDGKPDARLPDLFEKALQAVVSGNWSGVGRTGAWSIRTFK